MSADGRNPSRWLIGGVVASAICVGLIVYANFVTPSAPRADPIDVSKYASLTCDDWSSMTPLQRDEVSGHLLAHQVKNARDGDRDAETFADELASVCSTDPTSPLVMASLAAYLAS